jgi:hypothetical protein
MVGTTLLHARYNMFADVYIQHIEQDPDTGQIVRWWDYKNPQTIRCTARGIQGGGIRVVGSTERWEGDNYTDVEWAFLQTSAELSKRDRVGRIRRVEKDGTETELWRDIFRDEAGNLNYEPIIFEVLGATPLFEPYGRNPEFNVLLTRAEERGDLDEARYDPQSGTGLDDNEDFIG